MSGDDMPDSPRAVIPPDAGFVTAHAVVRYAELMLGVDFSDDRERFALMAQPPGAGEVDWLLTQALAARGFNVEAIRGEIARRAAMGVAAGAKRVVADGVIYPIVDGRVVTALFRRPRRFRNLSNRKGSGRPRQPRRRREMEAISDYVD